MMMGEVCVEQKMRKCKAFKAYGLFIVLHEQYFVENILNLLCVTEPIVSTAVFIWCNGFNHYCSQEFSSETEVNILTYPTLWQFNMLELVKFHWELLSIDLRLNFSE